jgi:hypothetical protein
MACGVHYGQRVSLSPDSVTLDMPRDLSLVRYDVTLSYGIIAWVARPLHFTGA